MDAAGSRRAVLLGHSEGGPMCALFAATFPERTEQLIIYGSYAARIPSDDYPWAPDPAVRARHYETLLAQWGGPFEIECLHPAVRTTRNCAGGGPGTCVRRPARQQWWR